MRGQQTKVHLEGIKSDFRRFERKNGGVGGVVGGVGGVVGGSVVGGIGGVGFLVFIGDAMEKVGYICAYDLEPRL